MEVQSTFVNRFADFDLDPEADFEGEFGFDLETVLISIFRMRGFCKSSVTCWVTLGLGGFGANLGGNNEIRRLCFVFCLISSIP